MLIPMLKAIDGMLAKEPKDTLSIRAECARTIVSELIAGLESTSEKVGEEAFNRRQGVDLERKVSPDVPVLSPKTEVVEKIPQGQYKVVVDSNSKLVGIKGLPLDALVEIDGKKITHQEAIGKPFTQGRIL